MRSILAPIRLLVTDLDNTLYDWVGFFVPAFYAMAEEASSILNIDIELLLNSLKKVHQWHGSSEHPFALLETDVVQRALSGLSEREQLTILDPAFHRFNSVRKHALKLYEGVFETLQELVGRGVVIVAYTDARIPNSLYRIKRLGIDQFITRLYAPGPRFPIELTSGTEHNRILNILPQSDKKPNAKSLLDICQHFGVEPANTLYVGDSLTRDIFMANLAGVRSAWAQYGTLVEPLLWEKLVRVTHWTTDDLFAEAKLRKEAAHATPDIILHHFSDLLLYVPKT